MKRLLDSSSNPRAVALLEAGLHDAPSADAASRVALALGVAGAVTTASVAGAAANAPVVLGGGKSAVASLVGKWLLIGAVGGVATSGAVVALQARSTASNVATPARDDTGMPPARTAAKTAPFRASPAPEPAPERPPEAPAVRALSGAPRTVASPVASSRAPESAPAPSADHAPALPAGPSALGADVAIIDEARRAVGSGDFRRALEALNAYDRQKRTYVLDREARLLRIDSLVLAGDRKEALRLASDYLRTFPDDPHAPRLRSLVGGGER